jgi:cytochrome c peroxidase
MGLGGNALRKFPLVHHAAWSMARPDEIKALQSRYAEFLEELEAQKRYFREFKDDAGRLEYLESRMGKKAVGLLQNGFFHRVDQDKRLTVMTSRGCTACHDEKGGGVAQELARKILFPFENRGGFLGAKKPERYFRVPLLRNIVRTKPYFHNGAVEKLEDAVKFMARHQSRVEITDGEIDTMIRFFKAVDGKIVEYIK